jgi:sugar phosphate isomerase/epimerase
LGRTAPIAEKLGLQIVFENHTRAFPWKYCDFAMHSAIFLEILHQLDNTSVRVNFDTANTTVANEDPVALLESIVDKVVSVHAFDVQAPGSLKPVIVGTGAAPIPELFSILKKNGFDSWICVEEASQTGRAGFKQSVANVRRIWNNS